jgi:hypothetical protein
MNMSGTLMHPFSLSDYQVLESMPRLKCSPSHRRVCSSKGGYILGVWATGGDERRGSVISHDIQNIS